MDTSLKKVDSAISASWVIPIEPFDTVLADHTVVVDQGRILDLLPTSEFLQRYLPTVHTERPGHLLMPGLVNSHAHAAMSLLRGAGDDLPLMKWLHERIWPLEGALVSEAFVYQGTLLAGLEMLRGGTTCASDMYFFPEAAGRAFRALGMRAVLGATVLEFPGPYASSVQEYIDKGLAARDALQSEPLLSFTLAPHAPYTISNATFERLVVLAEELDLPLHVHVHETEEEVRESVATHGVRPLARLRQLGVVGPRLIAVHAVHLSPNEIDMLAELNASMAHCPASNLKLASGFAPVAELLRAGVNVCIGTDGAASNNRLDMLGELRLAALLAKGVSGDPTAFPAHAALRAATLNGARAVGLDGQIGSLVPGKQADLIAIDLDQLDSQPLFNAASQVVYTSGREQVTDVWISGQPRLLQREILNLDPVKEVEGSIAAWQQRAFDLIPITR